LTDAVLIDGDTPGAVCTARKVEEAACRMGIDEANTGEARGVHRTPPLDRSVR
jgi:hypothetical protein